MTDFFTICARSGKFKTCFAHEQSETLQEE